MAAMLRVRDVQTRDFGLRMETPGMPHELGDIGILIEMLQGCNQALRLHAAQVLGSIGSEARLAARALAEALNDEDVHLRYHAAYALCQLGRDAQPAFPAVLQLL